MPKKGINGEMVYSRNFCIAYYKKIVLYNLLNQHLRPLNRDSIYFIISIKKIFKTRLFFLL